MQGLWYTLDGNIGLIIACLPALRPYLRYWRGGSHSGQGSRYYGSKTIDGRKMVNTVISTPNFDRIDGAYQDGQIQMRVDITQRTTLAHSRGAVYGPGNCPWRQASDGTSLPTSAKFDEVGSDVELVVEREIEQRV